MKNHSLKPTSSCLSRGKAGLCAFVWELHFQLSTRQEETSEYRIMSMCTELQLDPMKNEKLALGPQGGSHLFLAFVCFFVCVCSILTYCTLNTQCIPGPSDPMEIRSA